MSDIGRLQARFRAIALAGAGIFALTLLARAALPGVRPAVNGLILGETGGAYVVYSMIRQGHLRDGLTGKPLFASGMLGMFTRFAVLVAVMIIAVKSPQMNPLTALAGYMLGFVLIFAGLIGHAGNRRLTSGGK